MRLGLIFLYVSMRQIMTIGSLSSDSSSWEEEEATEEEEEERDEEDEEAKAREASS